MNDMKTYLSCGDAIFMLQETWADVRASIIRNCLRKGDLVMSPEEELETLDTLAKISTKEFEQWIATNDSTPVSRPVTDEDSIPEVRERFAGNEEEEEEEEEECRPGLR